MVEQNASWHWKSFMRPMSCRPVVSFFPVRRVAEGELGCATPILAAGRSHERCSLVQSQGQDWCAGKFWLIVSFDLAAH